MNTTSKDTLGRVNPADQPNASAELKDSDLAAVSGALSGAFSQAIKSIGEGMTAMARKG